MWEWRCRQLKFRAQLYSDMYNIKDGQSLKNRNVRIIAGSVCSFEYCSYFLCSYAKLALFCCSFLVNENKKRAGLRNF